MPHAIYQRGEERLVGSSDAAVVRRLLQRDIIPMIACERLSQRISLEADSSVVGEVTKLVGSGVLLQERMVLRQRATAVV